MKALLAAVALSLAPAAHAFPVVAVTPAGPVVVVRPVRHFAVWAPPRLLRYGRFAPYGRFYRRFR